MARMFVDSTKLDNDMKSVANAIRAKSGNSAKLSWPQGFINEIGKISGGGDYPDHDNPNYRPHSHKEIATFKSVADVDAFCSKYNHANNYKGIEESGWQKYELKLSCGMHIRIKTSESDYSTYGVIAGFDCEYKQKAADGTIYDNGYGIMMIVPYDTIYDNVDGYINLLKPILGNHLVERNVLLSNAFSGNDATNYAWTKAYATSLSSVQHGNSVIRNKYDVGEANYILPLRIAGGPINDRYLIDTTSYSSNIQYPIRAKNKVIIDNYLKDTSGMQGRYQHSSIGDYSSNNISSNICLIMIR